MGQSSEPLLHISQLEKLADADHGRAVGLDLTLSVPGALHVLWRTMLWQNSLFVQVPEGLLPDGSKESFVALLEFAEETMKVGRVVIALNKQRKDRSTLVRTFMFFGFEPVVPGGDVCAFVGGSDDLYLAYTIE